MVKEFGAVDGRILFCLGCSRPQNACAVCGMAEAAAAGRSLGNGVWLCVAGGATVGWRGIWNCICISLLFICLRGQVFFSVPFSPFFQRRRKFWTKLPGMIHGPIIQVLTVREILSEYRTRTVHVHQGVSIDEANLGQPGQESHRKPKENKVSYYNEANSSLTVLAKITYV